MRIQRVTEVDGPETAAATRRRLMRELFLKNKLRLGLKLDVEWYAHEAGGGGS